MGRPEIDRFISGADTAGSSAGVERLHFIGHHGQHLSPEGRCSWAVSASGQVAAAPPEPGGCGCKVMVRPSGLSRTSAPASTSALWAAHTQYSHAPHDVGLPAITTPSSAQPTTTHWLKKHPFLGRGPRRPLADHGLQAVLNDGLALNDRATEPPRPALRPRSTPDRDGVRHVLGQVDRPSRPICTSPWAAPPLTSPRSTPVAVDGEVQRAGALWRTSPCDGQI